MSYCMFYFTCDRSPTGGFRRGTVADLAEPSSLVAAEHERLVAMVTGDDQLVEVLVTHVHVTGHPRRVRAADHCTPQQRTCCGITYDSEKTLKIDH